MPFVFLLAGLLWARHLTSLAAPPWKQSGTWSLLFILSSVSSVVMTRVDCVHGSQIYVV